MSGDVQPRKRKDKKRKRDFADRKSEGDITLSRQDSLQEDDESSHGVHFTKMGSDDVHLHVQEDHGTGGHWCAKLLFFMLLSILLGLIGLIIMENRGLADLDTPLAESRYSNYFDGWIEEHVEDHEHDAVEASIDEHEEHDEPFEEVEDNSEAVDEDADEQEEDDDEANADERDDNEGNEIEDEAEAINESANMQERYEQQQDDDDDDDNYEADNDEEEEDEEEEEEDNIDDDDEVLTKQETDSQENLEDNEEEEDDEEPLDENFMEIVENDAQEEKLLKEKAAQDSKEEEDDDAEADGEDADEDNANDAADAAKSWATAQIKPKAGGEQFVDDELDAFERDLRAANEEMMREFSYQ